MNGPLAIGGALVLMIFGGWVAGDVEWVIYPLLGAPIAGFFLGVLMDREMSFFYATASLTALCLMLWAVARNDVRRMPDGAPARSSGPAQFEPR